MKKIILSFIFIYSLFLLKPVNILAASLSFSPASGNYKVGDYIYIDVVLTGNDQPINAVSGNIIFPKNLLSVSSLSQDTSIIKYWTTSPTFSNSGGTINFEGVVPNPGFSSARGKIITIRFLAKAAGNVNISFENGSVLANDGLATEVLESLNKANYTIGSKPVSTPIVDTPVAPTPVAESLSTDVSTTPMIDSPTHPNQDAWYSNNSPVFNWVISGRVSTLRLEYDNNPIGKPSKIYTPAISSKTFSNLKDGLYYLHLQFKSGQTWGDTTTYRFQIDTTPPELFVPTITYNKKGIPSLVFSTTDSGSGINHYEIVVDNDYPIIIDTKEADYPYVLSKNTPGSHAVVLSAVDKAGNRISTSFPLFFMDATKSVISFSGSFILLFIIIIISLIIIWFATLRFRVLKSKMGQDLETIIDTMKEDFVLLRESFDIHNSSVTKNMSTKEKVFIKKIFKNSQDHINLVERDINHKIKSLKEKK